MQEIPILTASQTSLAHSLPSWGYATRSHEIPVGYQLRRLTPLSPRMQNKKSANCLVISSGLSSCDSKYANILDKSVIMAHLFLTIPRTIYNFRAKEIEQCKNATEHYSSLTMGCFILVTELECLFLLCIIILPRP